MHSGAEATVLAEIERHQARILVLSEEKSALLSANDEKDVQLAALAADLAHSRQETELRISERER